MKLKNAFFLTLFLFFLSYLPGGVSIVFAEENVQTGTGEVIAGKERKKIKIAFVYVAPVGDAGWTWAHEQGRQKIAKLPFVEETQIAENVPEGAEATRVITQFAEAGFDLIFTTSFGYMEPTLEVARNYPKTIFMHCSGYKTADNVGTYFGRIEQARYLTGIVAASLTSAGRIGYVAAHPIPEVIRGINAFTLGVRTMKPDARVCVVWTHSWYDPAKERQAAEALLDAGADVIAQHQDSPGPQQAAQDRGKFSIGYNADMSQFAPKAHAVAAIWRWESIYEKIARDVAEGTWKPEKIWWGMEKGVVDISPLAAFVPEETREIVRVRREEFLSGKDTIFMGPLRDQNGKERIPAGRTATDEELLGMDWFVEGVEGTVPK